MAVEPEVGRPIGSLRSALASTLSGNVIFAGSQFVMITALARLTTPEEVGAYALALAITAPAFIFGSLKLRYVQATDVSGEFAFGDYFGLRLLAILVLLVLAICGFFLGLLPGGADSVILAISALKAFDLISDCFYGALHKRSHMGTIAASLSVRGLVSAAAFVVAVYIERTALSGVVAASICYGFCAVGDGVLARRVEGSIRPVINRFNLRRLVSLTLPLGGSIAVGSLTTNVPRYVLQSFTGASAVGIYSALSYFLIVGGMVVGAAGQAATPRLAQSYADGDTVYFRRLLKRLVFSSTCFALILTGFVACFGGQILDLAFGRVYAKESGVLLVLVASTIPAYAAVFLGTALNAVRVFRLQLPLALVALVGVAILCVLLIPSYGLMGAAIALVGGGMINLISYLWIVASRLLEIERGVHGRGSVA